MNLKKHLELGWDNLLNALNKDKDFLPYWMIHVNDKKQAEYQFRKYCNGHNIGRWWNVMLRLETILEKEIPKDIYNGMITLSKKYSQNPMGIFQHEFNENLSIDDWYIHSYRESMLSFALLARLHDEKWAALQGMKTLKIMSKASEDLGKWNFSNNITNRPAPYTSGRVIEGILELYNSLGKEEILNEAKRLCEYHINNTFVHDGSLATGSGNHTHSYLNTARGVLLYGMKVGNQYIIEVIRNTFFKAILNMITESGFILHDINDDKGISVGDTASTGDVLHIALLLWEVDENPYYLDLAEKLVRCRILPVQVKEAMNICPIYDSKEDKDRDLENRFIGAIAGVGQIKGQMCITDFTASCLHSLCEFYKRSLIKTDDLYSILFHINNDLDGIAVECARNKEALINISTKKPRKIRIRIPGWVKEKEISSMLNNESTQVENIRNGFMYLPSFTGTYKIKYSLPLKTIKELQIRGNDIGKPILFNWKGDEIVGTNYGPYMAQFPSKNNPF